MRKLLCLSTIMLVCCAAFAGTWLGQPAIPSAGGSAFSDNFNRADNDSLGANWTEAAGDIDIVSNALSFQSGSSAENKAIYTGTAATGSVQYEMATATAAPSTYPGFLFRYTNSSSPFYQLSLGLNEDLVWWYRVSAISGTYTEVANTALTVNTGDVFGMTVTGTGTGTVIRIWRNPTGLPTSASDWNGDSTPDASFTTDPASPVDTGNNVGLDASQTSAGQISYDDYFGGSLP